MASVDAQAIPSLSMPTRTSDFGRLEFVDLEALLIHFARSQLEYRLINPDMAWCNFFYPLSL